MKAILQRVSHAAVRVAERQTGSIERGFLVLLGVGQADTERDVRYIVDQVLKIRVFADDAQKMNQSLTDVHGSLLIVSQFTLFADTSKGRRPSFLEAAGHEQGKALYEHTIKVFTEEGVHVETGEFGAHMQVELVNDGPVTIILDSQKQ